MCPHKGWPAAGKGIPASNLCRAHLTGAEVGATPPRVEYNGFFGSRKPAGRTCSLQRAAVFLIMASKNNLPATTQPECAHQQVARTSLLSCMKMRRHNGISADFVEPTPFPDVWWH